jgi:hypothetical protein
MTKIAMYAKSRTSPFNRTMTTSRMSFMFNSEYGDCICSNMRWQPVRGYVGRIFPPTKGRLELSYMEDDEV